MRDTLLAPRAKRRGTDAVASVPTSLHLPQGRNLSTGPPRGSRLALYMSVATRSKVRFQEW